MASVILDDLTVRFGDFTAVDAIDLTIDDGEFVVFLGPSGCGKTTTLRCIAGLEQPTEGQIRFGDRPVDHLDAAQRNVAMVFQFVSLYPHMSVRQNIAFPMQAAGKSRNEIGERIDWVTGIFDLAGILDSRPAQLPPGARQKVALARAVVREPNVLLLDEPLSAIDEQFREDMRWELRHLQKQLGVTSVYVTHDQREAMSLADRIVLMRDGRFVQVAPPTELFADPADAFAGFFIGSPAMNFIAARRTGDRVRLTGSDRAVSLPDRMLAAVGDEPFQIGIRPQHVTVGAAATEPAAFEARLADRYSIGREHWFDFMVGDQIHVGMSDGGPVGDGDTVVVRMDTAHLLLFTDDGRRIRPEPGP